ncbi:Peroxin-3 [Coprinopsis sp. MPI-PUGE-AT-0042]|nr:Peroxin-3 [Coprinopsis sp. MPI-PUGE-AT-0042]
MPLSSLLPSRKTLATAGGFIGGMYFAQNFMKEKLEEAKEKLEEDRLAKENLKRRFSQTHHTTSYTILALLPELSSQILSEMDVEALTKELQALGRSGKATATGPRALPPSSTFPALPTSPSLASSVELIQNPEAASLASSYANVAAPGQAPVSSSLEDPASHTRSTTEESGGSGSESLVHVVAPSPVLPINEPPFPVSASSESMFSSTASLVSNVPSEVSSTNPARTKAELWNEVKILTLTRTLTTLYSITLLSLLTTLQLSTLARYKYLLSIYEQEKEERMREDMLRKFDISNMVMKSVGGVVGGLLGKGVGSVPIRKGKISPETENKYLTLSWWLLHVGCKDVGERVRRGVEDVFEGVSLKTKLSAKDLHRLLSDVRRRVEYEVTFEGVERRVDFLSSLLPSTPETIHHVLVQGGFTPPPPPGCSSTAEAYRVHDLHPPEASSSKVPNNPPKLRDPSPRHLPDPYPHITNDPAFLHLVHETRQTIASVDFGIVLGACLEKSVEVLFDGLGRNVFVESSPPPVVPQQGGVNMFGEGEKEKEEVRIRLAGLLPGLARWSQLALNGMPNELVDSILSTYEIPVLSAIVFGRFEEDVGYY